MSLLKVSLLRFRVPLDFYRHSFISYDAIYPGYAFSTIDSPSVFQRLSHPRLRRRKENIIQFFLARTLMTLLVFCSTCPVSVKVLATCCLIMISKIICHYMISPSFFSINTSFDIIFLSRIHPSSFVFFKS